MVLVAMDISPEFYNGSGSPVNYRPGTEYRFEHQSSPLAELDFMLYQGSGGTYTSSLDTSPSGSRTVIDFGSKHALSSVIEEISSAFGLNKTDLASVCKVQSRKTLYNWINGEAEPQKETLHRIFDLLVIARAWKHSGLPTDRNSIFSPTTKGQSIFDLLRAEALDKSLILFAGSRANLLSSGNGPLQDPFA